MTFSNCCFRLWKIQGKTCVASSYLTYFSSQFYNEHEQAFLVKYTALKESFNFGKTKCWSVRLRQLSVNSAKSLSTLRQLSVKSVQRVQHFKDSTQFSANSPLICTPSFLFQLRQFFANTYQLSTNSVPPLCQLRLPTLHQFSVIPAVEELTESWRRIDGELTES